MGSQVGGHRPSWWKRRYNRQERLGGMSFQEAGRSHGVHTQEAKNKQEVGSGSQGPKPTLGDPLPSARSHLPKVPQASQTVNAYSWRPSIQMHEVQCQVQCRAGVFLNITQCDILTKQMSHLRPVFLL